MKKITLLLIAIFCISSNLNAQTPAIGNMNFGTGYQLMGTTGGVITNNYLSSTYTNLNSFDLKIVASGAANYIVAFDTGFWGQAGQIVNAAAGDAALVFDPNNSSLASNLGIAYIELSSASGNEVAVTNFQFAIHRISGFGSFDFTVYGYKDGAIVGTKSISPSPNTLLYVNLASPTTGSFYDIDRIRIQGDSGIFNGGFSIDNMNVEAVSPPPTVSTLAASAVADTSATLGGNVTDADVLTVTERGVVYSITSENNDPEIGGTGVTKDTNGTGLGVFSKSITGLAVGTQYSFKAYATSAAGTAYGTAAIFTTTGKSWTGATDTDWATASNWSPSSVPITTDNVVIPNVTNKPVISATTGAVANNLTIDTGSSLTVNSGGSIIIDGTATVNGDFNYIVTVADANWHLISSPVSGAQYDDTWNTANGINTNGTNEAVATYINTSDNDGDWVYFQDGGTATTFESGKGYSMQRTGPGDYTFTGTFPTFPIGPSISVNDLSGVAENRWNLIGNPLPAYISIDDFLTINTTPLTDTHEAVYVWNASAGEYQIVTTGQIHPGQAFFVNANVASTLVNFTDAMQSAQTGITFYKNADPSISLKVNDGTATKTTKINYADGMTTGLDPRYDVGTFTGASGSFGVFTHLVENSEGVNFGLQALPNNNYDDMVVPVGLKASAGKEITFTIEANNFPAGIKIYLEDRDTNTFTRLDEVNGSYTTTLTSSKNGIGQFYIHTASKTLSVDTNVNLDNVSIYKLDNKTLRVAGLLKESTNLTVFNLLGKQVLKSTFTSNGVKDIALPTLSKGVYLIKLETEQGQLNKKIILE